MIKGTWSRGAGAKEARLMFQSIGFLGTGQMGGALAQAAVKGAGGAAVLLANRTPAKAQALADQLGCQATDNQTVAARCELIFLGVKPQMMAGLLESIAPTLAARKDRFVLASMAAGPHRPAHPGAGGGELPRHPPDAQHSCGGGGGGHSVLRPGHQGRGAGGLSDPAGPGGFSRPGGRGADRRGLRRLRLRPRLLRPAGRGPGRRRGGLRLPRPRPSFTPPRPWRARPG